MLLRQYFSGKTERNGAGEGNRTPVISLEGFCSTIELHPLIQTIIQGYHLIVVEGDGFEPS